MKRAALALALLLLAGVGGALAQPKTEAMEPPPTLHQTSPSLSQQAGGLSVSPAFGSDGVAWLPTGVALPFYVALQNPRQDGGIQGTIRLTPTEGTTVNRTEIPYDLPAGGYDAWTVLVHGRDGESKVVIEAPDVPEALVTLPLLGVPPLAVALPPWLASMNVGARELIEFEVNVTNHGDTPSSETLTLYFREEAIAQRPLDPPLAPGETRVVDFGTLRPPPPETAFETSRTDYYSVTWRVGTSDARPTLDMQVDNGTLLRASLATGFLRVAFGPTLRIVEESVALGEPSYVIARVRHDGDEAIDVVYTIQPVGFALSIHPDWRIAGAQGTLRLQPGSTRDLRLDFVPRLATTFEVQAAIYNSELHISDVRRVDIPSPVRVMPNDSAWQMRPSVGDTTAWNVSVETMAPLEDVELRVAIASRQGWSFDGLVRSGDIAAVDVRDAPPRGDLRPGETIHANVTLTTRASGSYLVIPYLASGPDAYLGALTDIDVERMQTLLRDSWEAMQMRSVILVANVLPVAVPPALAFLPAVVLLAATIALWQGRRLYVR